MRAWGSKGFNAGANLWLQMKISGRCRNGGLSDFEDLEREREGRGALMMLTRGVIADLASAPSTSSKITQLGICFSPSSKVRV